ncbi:MAG: VanZ family protein [Gemmatimonadaceae bacterium]
MTGFILNVLLFAPFGLALGLLVPRRAWVWFIPPVVSLTIELLQWGLIPGRSAALGDLLANSIGGIVGILCGVFSHFLLLPNTRRARRLAAVSGVLSIVALAVGGSMLAPSVPFQVFWVQWLPNKGGYDVFAGQLDSLEVNGRSLRQYEEVDPVHEVAVLSGERNEIRAVVHPFGRGSSRIALIARLAGPVNERFMIGRYGDDFVYRSRMRAADFGLRVPIGSLDNAFRDVTGSNSAADTATIELESSALGSTMHLKARGPAGEVSRSLALSPAVAWSFLAPRDLPLGSHYLWWNALFLMFVSLPVMYWLAVSATPRTRRRDTARGRAKTAIMLVALIMGLASVHIISGGAPFALLEWTGVAAAGAIGLLLSAATRRARRPRPTVEDHHTRDFA